MKKIILLSFLSSVFLFSSCQKETYEDASPINKEEYMPLRIGKYITYQVDSTIWDDYLKTTVVNQYQMKYEVIDTFTDGESRLAYITKVTRKGIEDESYRDDHTLQHTFGENYLETNELHMVYTSLVFPIIEGKSWDGLSKINKSNDKTPQFLNNNWNFTYQNVGKTLQIGAYNFPNTVTVHHIDNQINDPDIDKDAYAEKTLSKEIYAKDLGLIYKEYVYWVFQPAAGGSGYRKGVGVKKQIIDHN